MNLRFVHTFYHISKNTKQDIQNANKRYRERLQQLRTTKGGLKAPYSC